MTERPAFVADEHLTFLDDLRASGVTNMFGARPYLVASYPELDEPTSMAVLVYWSKTFGQDGER